MKRLISLDNVLGRFLIQIEPSKVKSRCLESNNIQVGPLCKLAYLGFYLDRKSTFSRHSRLSQNLSTDQLKCNLQITLHYITNTPKILILATRWRRLWHYFEQLE